MRAAFEGLRGDLRRILGEPASDEPFCGVERLVWHRVPGDAQGLCGGVILAADEGSVWVTADAGNRRVRTWCVAGEPMAGDLCASPAAAVTAALAWVATRGGPMPRIEPGPAGGPESGSAFEEALACCEAALGRSARRQGHGTRVALWPLAPGRTLWLYEGDGLLYLYGDRREDGGTADEGWCLRGSLFAEPALPMAVAVASAALWAGAPRGATALSAPLD